MPERYFVFTCHNANASISASTRKRKNFDSCFCAYASLYFCLRQGRYHCEITIIVFALELASLVKFRHLETIGHFRVPLCLCFKESLSAKMTLICMKMKLHAELIFIWMDSLLDSFWNTGTRELENGLFIHLSPETITQVSYEPLKNNSVRIDINFCLNFI